MRMEDALTDALRHGLDVELLDERAISTLSYHYLSNGVLTTAPGIFRLNEEAFPASANAYDCRGEACLEAEQNACALQNYRAALELAPNNTVARDKLEKLGYAR